MPEGMKAAGEHIGRREEYTGSDRDEKNAHKASATVIEMDEAEGGLQAPLRCTAPLDQVSFWPTSTLRRSAASRPAIWGDSGRADDRDAIDPIDPYGTDWCP